MTELETLHRSILENRNDDLPRLILADWLSENGEEDRGEFIRVQCELARLGEPPFSGCGSYAINMRKGERCLRCNNCRRYSEIYRRDLDLLTPANAAKWSGQVATEKRWVTTEGIQTFAVFGIPPSWPIRWEWSRGFISAITLSWSDFQRHAPALLWWAGRKCDRCADGIVGKDGTHYVKDHDHVSQNANDGWMKCSACRGTGELPGSDMPCLDCWHEFGCYHCNYKGRVPVPLTLQHQPIETVTFSDWPNLGQQGIDAEDWAMMGRGGAAIVIERGLRELWPSVQKWTFPSV